MAKRCGDWKLVKKLGDGGNSEVWAAEDSMESRVALKIFIKPQDLAYQRFQDEVAIATKHRDVPGVLPILGSYLPAQLTPDDPPWLTMPIAVPMTESLTGRSSDEVVRRVAEVAETLELLHEQAVAHRDIKPANLYVLGDRACVADFGLVDFPDKKDLTQKGNRIGAKWTLAPEMERSAETADGKLADVYSLGKTLWILLTGIATGFEGQYRADDAGISLRSFRSNAPLLCSLEDLLVEATAHEPSVRPSMKQFHERIVRWLQRDTSFTAESLGEWKQVQLRLFPFGISKHAEWSDPAIIVSVLSVVGMSDQLNHMFFPDGGGLDLRAARLSTEPGCIELHHGSASIVRPKRLIFESFGKYEEWAYFWLETLPLKPSGIYPQLDETSTYEEVAELRQGEYLDCSVFDEGQTYDGDGNPQALPLGSRVINRIFCGSFIIFAKASMYNYLTDYTGAHNKSSPEQFRKKVDALLETRGEELERIRRDKLL